jgi:hypothetical protein
VGSSKVPPLAAPEGSLSRSVQFVILVVGVGLIVTGAVAVFTTSNDTGTAALLAVGTALVALAVVGNRIETIRFRELEIQLAEQRVELALRGAEASIKANEPEEAAKFRNEALKGLRELHSFGIGYEVTRETMPPGPRRTAKMDSDFVEARRRTRAHPPSSDQVRDLFLQGGDGDRIAALAAMTEDPSLRDFDLILDAIANSRSAFEQHRAMAVAQNMVHELNTEQQARLARTLDDRRHLFGPGRRYIAERIESSIEASEHRSGA